jgi:hypothetical protein
MIIAVIFSVILKFFLGMQLEQAKNLKAERQYMTAQIMYTVTKKQDAKSIRFNTGMVVTKDRKSYIVTLLDGSKYSFGI